MKTESADVLAADPLTGAASHAPRTGPAEVCAVLSSRRLRVRFEGDPRAHDAQVAVPGYDDPREADRVLAMTDDAGSTWIVGVIRAPRPASLLEEALEAPETEDTVRVHDRTGRLLFEYDPESERAILHVPSGDLELSVPDGALSLKARDGVHVDTDGDVKVRGGRSVRLEAARGEGPAARLTMQPGELSLVASAITAAADRAELLAAKLGVRAQRVESHVDRVRTVVKVLDLRAGRIVERARDVYREAEGLSQTRAGTLRMVAKKAASLVGENTLLKARDRMKIKGERIHLA
jgi:hypothetical protein